MGSEDLLELDVAVVGGGAAGFFAALETARIHASSRIAIFEKNPRPLTKVSISGGGRCNVTHACYDPQKLIEYYPRGGRELLGPFHRWQPRNTIEWFQARDVPLKTEEDGRVFPLSDDSRAITDVLIYESRQLGVELMPDHEVLSFERNADGRFKLRLKGPRTSFECAARRLLIAVGGLKVGTLTASIEALGHTIQAPIPSLFTFNCSDERLRDLAGVTVQTAHITLPEVAKHQTGPVLITHRGFSGPATICLSATAAPELARKEYRFPVQISWIGPSDQGKTLERLGALRNLRRRQKLATHTVCDIPHRLWIRILESAGIDSETTWSHLSREATERLARELCASEYLINGRSPNKEEFVTCGGIELSEISFQTMESRLVPNLYFAGETLNIDALTGGFNLQAAWTTGFLAGEAMAG